MVVMNLWTLVAVAGIVPAILVQGGAQNPDGATAATQPPLPFYDWKACPFEGCSYREWTARKPVAVYDTWKRKRQVLANLSPGDKVTGVTGVVITFRPAIIRMDRDLPAAGLKRGDTIQLYTNQGEGFSAAWFNGHYYPEFDITFARWPDGEGCRGATCAGTFIEKGKQAWWAKVKLPSGQTGWVNMDDAEFDGVDALG